MELVSQCRIAGDGAIQVILRGRAAGKAGARTTVRRIIGLQCNGVGLRGNGDSVAEGLQLLARVADRGPRAMLDPFAKCVNRIAGNWKKRFR